MYVLEGGEQSFPDADLPIVSDRGRLVGIVNLTSFILADPAVRFEETMDHEVLTAPVDADQEEVSRILSRYCLLALPVVDEEDHLLGIVTVDEVVDVPEQEATDVIYRLAQVSEEADTFSPVPRAVRARLPWIVVSQGTALISATVVAQFAGTIAAVVILAALMAVVAAQGGNAGNQSMTIIVRSLALGQIDLKDLRGVFRHELGVSMLHGLALGALVAIVIFVWLGNPVLSAVIGTAMMGNFLVAAVVGVLVPMTLRRVGVDSAFGSSMMVTASANALGVTLFLGLASYFVVWLV